MIEIFGKINFALILILMIWQGHNFAQVTEAQLLWPVQNYDMICYHFFTLDQQILQQDLHHELIICL